MYVIAAAALPVVSHQHLSAACNHVKRPNNVQMCPNNMDERVVQLQSDYASPSPPPLLFFLSFLLLFHLTNLPVTF